MCLSIEVAMPRCVYIYIYVRPKVVVGTPLNFQAMPMDPLGYTLNPIAPEPHSSTNQNSTPRVPLKWIEHGAYGDLTIIYPRPYSIYLRGTIYPKP